MAGAGISSLCRFFGKTNLVKKEVRNTEVRMTPKLETRC